MDSDALRGQRCLDLIQAIIPYQYGQWLVEDPNSHDYRVVAAIIPEGEEGYDVAHRTGVIGQVFRTEQPILVPNVRSHALYDLFDGLIDWELSFPLFADGKLKAVVNLEGTGAIELGLETWESIRRVVEETSQKRPPATPPRPDSLCLVKTRRMLLRACGDAEQRSDVVELARAIARGGQSTLLVGDYPELLRGRGPTLAEANQQGLGVSYCYFGVEPRLDLLAAGPITQEFVLDNHSGWWDNCRGRYAFVLLSEEA